MKPCQAWLAVGVLVAGCAGQATRPPANDATSIPEQRGWFCQPSASGQGWQCVQNAELAENPKPTRPPPQPRTSQSAPAPADGSPPAPASSPEPLSPPERLSPPEPAASVQPTAGPVTPPEAGAPGPAPAPDADAASGSAGDGQPLAAESMPDYVRLAYQPDKPEPLTDLPGSFYALQVLAMPSRSSLEAFTRRHGISNASGARVERNGELYYVLVLGVYETRAIARKAAAHLPPPFTNTQPWIRSLASLQAAIKRGDMLAGQSDTSS